MLLTEETGCWRFWDRWLPPLPVGHVCELLSDQVPTALKSKCAWGHMGSFFILKLIYCLPRTRSLHFCDLLIGHPWLQIQIIDPSHISLRRKSRILLPEGFHGLGLRLKSLCLINCKDPDIWFPTGTVILKNWIQSYIRNVCVCVCVCVCLHCLPHPIPLGCPSSSRCASNSTMKCNCQLYVVWTPLMFPKPTLTFTLWFSAPHHTYISDKAMIEFWHLGWV